MKDNLTIFLCVSIFIIYTHTSCDNGFEDCHNTVLITNNSSKTIYAVGTLKEGFFNFNPTKEDIADDYRIKPNESTKAKIGIQLSCWEQTLEQTGGYLYIYIYDAELLENPENNWSDAQKHPIIQFKLSAKDLKNMNWEVKYKN